ncbi:MerR family transcriptional regulator [Pseudonocardia spinosispora]|uniref:MerR family transcriptional regulator n=1 Tax=Pseudonocardia spinosispora TaxID=103441 RepID=UPI000422421B|nr:MerR family transcriptional regulator [Pseudonocardia spinosispora]
MGKTWDIGEVAELTGLAPSALRHYEREGLLHPAGRAGGRRFYDATGLRQLATIDHWQRAGLTLREMSELFHRDAGDVARMKELALIRIAELDRLIAHATQVREMLSHTTVCTHQRMDECPEYRKHIDAAVEQLLGGDLRDQPPPLQPMRRPTRADQ